MTEDNLMSDAVMVPRVPTGAMISAGERAAWDEDNSMPAISAMRKAWEAMLAASTPVGGWEDISTAPKDGTDVLLWSDIFAGEISGPVPCVGPLIGRYRNGVSDYAGEGWWDVEGGDACASWCLPTHWMPLPPPPSVSTGSRPQEAVPTEQAEPAVVARMVQRFLSWKLPETFNPDGGVRFDRGALHPAHWPSGTNLLDHTQATEMVRHMLAGEAA